VRVIAGKRDEGIDVSGAPRVLDGDSSRKLRGMERRWRSQGKPASRRGPGKSQRVRALFMTRACAELGALPTEGGRLERRPVRRQRRPPPADGGEQKAAATFAICELGRWYDEGRGCGFFLLGRGLRCR
jgi:hypothetical protein